jgi:hypothetical protein
LNNCAEINEYTIQDALHRYWSGRIYEVPNIYLYRWESDFISVTKSGYVHEYEIKTSKADYRNDHKNKTEKHGILINGFRTPDKWDLVNTRYKFTTDNKIICQRPNYFWFVCKQGIIEEVNNYAGLIIIKQHGGIDIIKSAPRLHKDKITEYQKTKILTSMYHRYWQMRFDLKRTLQDRTYQPVGKTA